MTKETFLFSVWKREVCGLCLCSNPAPNRWRSRFVAGYVVTERLHCRLPRHCLQEGTDVIMTWRIKYWEHNTEQHSDFICFCTAEQRHVTATSNGCFSPYSDDLFLLHCTVHFCSSVQEPGVQQPKLMFNSCCSSLLTQSWQKQHLVLVCLKGAVTEANLPAAVYFVAACPIPNKVASHELLLGVEVRPRLTLETCPRAAPGSTSWLRPIPRQEPI